MTKEQLQAAQRAKATQVADANEKQAGFSYAPGSSRQSTIDQATNYNVSAAEHAPQFGGYDDPSQSHYVNGVRYPGPAPAATPAPASAPPTSMPGPMVGDPGLAGGSGGGVNIPTGVPPATSAAPPASGGMSAPPTEPGAGWAAMTQGQPSGTLGVSSQQRQALSALSQMGRVY